MSSCHLCVTDSLAKGIKCSKRQCQDDSYWFLLLLKYFMNQFDIKELKRGSRKIYFIIRFKQGAAYIFRRILFHHNLHNIALCLWSSAFALLPEEKDIQEPCHCWTSSDLSSSVYNIPIYFLRQCQVHNPRLFCSKPWFSSCSSTSWLSTTTAHFLLPYNTPSSNLPLLVSSTLHELHLNLHPLICHHSASF